MWMVELNFAGRKVVRYLPRRHRFPVTHRAFGWRTAPARPPSGA
jgi:hypothetical protein